MGIDEGAVETLGELLHAVDYFPDSTGIIFICPCCELIEGVYDYEVGAVVLEVFYVVYEVFEGTGLATEGAVHKVLILGVIVGVRIDHFGYPAGGNAFFKFKVEVDYLRGGCAVA